MRRREKPPARTVPLGSTLTNRPATPRAQNVPRVSAHRPVISGSSTGSTLVTCNGSVRVVEAVRSGVAGRCVFQADHARHRAHGYKSWMRTNSTISGRARSSSAAKELESGRHGRTPSGSNQRSTDPSGQSSSPGPGHLLIAARRLTPSYEADTTVDSLPGARDANALASVRRPAGGQGQEVPDDHRRSADFNVD